MSLDYIFRRRSIRKYTDRPVTEEQIRSILAAAMAAPSARNLKPWRFVVIRERETLDEIAQIHPYGKMIYQASLVIAVCGDRDISPKRWDQDCAAATENILLALPELGLGGVWVAYHPRGREEDFLRKLLELPENVCGFALVPVGYPAETKPSRSQYDAENIHFEQW